MKLAPLALAVLLAAPLAAHAQVYVDNDNNEARRAAVNAARQEVAAAQNLLEAQRNRVRATFKANPELVTATEERDKLKAAYDEAARPILEKLRQDPAYQDALKQEEQAAATVTGERAEATTRAAAEAQTTAARTAGASSDEVAAAAPTRQPGNAPTAARPAAVTPAAEPTAVPTAAEASARASAEPAPPNNTPGGADPSAQRTTTAPPPAPASAEQVAAAEAKLQQRSKRAELEDAALKKEPKVAEAKAALDAQEAKLKVLDAQFQAALLNDPEFKSAQERLAQAKVRVAQAAGTYTGGGVIVDVD